MSDTYTNFPQLKYDPQELAQRGWGVANSGPNDSQLIVGFYRRSVLNRSKSTEQGMPVHEGRDYVKIQQPGETLNVVDREVTQQDTQRWPQKWQAYKQNVSQAPDGIPISLLFPASPEVEMTLRGYNINTVQQLAHLSAHAIGTVGMGCQNWVNKAQSYMAQAEKGVDHHKFNKAIDDKNREIATLKRQMAELTALVQGMTQRAQQGNYSAQAQAQNNNYDYQTAQINETHPSARDDTAFLQNPAEFIQDLSGSLEPSKRRGWPKGKPRKPKESNDDQ